METTPTTSNLDARGRRKSSPAADEYYSHKLHNINDPDGLWEDEINQLARHLSRAKKSGNTAQTVTLRERIADNCMKFFYITGINISSRDAFSHNTTEECEETRKAQEAASHPRRLTPVITQVDDMFVDALLDTLDNYDSSKGIFTHMLRNQYGYKRSDAAYAAAKEDTALGGSKYGAPISLDASVRQNDDGTTTVADKIGETDDYGDTEFDAYWREEDARKTLSTTDALEKEGQLQEENSTYSAEDKDDEVEDAILIEIIALIAEFLESTSKSANDTRKLYTKLFFTETLTRVTKLRSAGELAPLEKREKNLFGAVELPFQDSYTASICRTIRTLWQVDFVEGVPPVTKTVPNKEYGEQIEGNYNWKLPATCYINYLESLGGTASNPLVSQQRKHYEELLVELRKTK